MRFAKAGQAEQTAQRLAQIAHRFVRCHKRQPRTFDGLLAMQPPQAIAQRQRIDLLQYGSKAIAHAISLTQQTGTTPYQFLKVIGRHTQADHLCIQRQFLWCALQQFKQGFGGAGATQGLTQIGFAQGTGQQLQQT